ncbi:MAG: gamma-glutamyltransferase [Alphaproteobacteria bacterium]|nr:gamma-glutamyltransferase [Alphaproteobacteria bacterium]
MLWSGSRRCPMRRWLLILLILLPVLPATAQVPAAPEAASGQTAKPLVRATRHMVAAANPLAVDAGLAILRRGGSAVDAAIATQMVLNLVEPQSSGIGGGAFLLHWSAGERRLVSYDGREVAPAAARPDRFIDPKEWTIDFRALQLGGRPVGVPGLLRMLEMAHARHGKLPWRELFQPAIELAERGFAVSPRLHALIAADPALHRFAPARAYFYEPDGSPRAVGSRLANPALADTLRRIADGGADAFYAGEIAADIVRAVREAPLSPGDMTQEDLATYRAVEREPLCAPYRGYRVCGMGPPSSGGLAVLQILGILERHELAGLRVDSAEFLHLYREASALAFADRNLYVADPGFVSVPVRGLLAPAYLDARAGAIRPDRAMPRPAAGTPPLRDGGPGPRFRHAAGFSPELPSTSHLSIVDGDGNVLAMTTTIEAAFGSRQLVRGFLLNNQLTDFSVRPEQDGRSVANRVEPGKRPRSSMAPTIVFDAEGRPVIAVGSPGGAMIINYVAKALIAMIDWRLDPQAAVALPNFGSLGNELLLERGSALEAAAPALAAMGHRVLLRDETSGLQAIRLWPDRLEGGADPRREGRAAGD